MARLIANEAKVLCPINSYNREVILGTKTRDLNDVPFGYGSPIGNFVRKINDINNASNDKIGTYLPLYSEGAWQISEFTKLKQEMLQNESPCLISTNEIPKDSNLTVTRANLVDIEKDDESESEESSSSDEEKTRHCFYFNKHGYCHYQSKCWYLHVEAGKCKWMDRCRYKFCSYRHF